jgi:hypothetical protein
MKYRNCFLIVIVMLANLSFVSSICIAAYQINLFIPAFKGNGSLGVNAATVINLQIWQTLRRAPTPNPKKLNFGRALILWDNKPLPEQSHIAAEHLAEEFSVLAQMVLWGKAYAYGEGVVVQTNLSIPLYNDFRKHKNEIWKISFGGSSIEVDIPRRRFEMSSISLRPETIEKYSVPDALKIHRDRHGDEAIGVIGNEFTALQFEHDLAKVESNGIVGWVRLPELGKKRSEVVDLVGGIIRIFRGDWDGAAEYMKRVVDKDNTKTPLKIDAYLYWGMALEKSGQPGINKIKQAYLLNPYSQTTVQYMIMSYLSSLKRMRSNSGSKDQKKEIMTQIQRVISINAYLFPPNDPWIGQVLMMIGHKES